MIDQIVEKGHNVGLKKQILAAGDSKALDTIIIETNSLEVVQRQLGEFSGQHKQQQDVNSSRSQSTARRQQ
nr:unnamed protein product [Callosobruchus analis]